MTFAGPEPWRPPSPGEIAWHATHVARLAERDAEMREARRREEQLRKTRLREQYSLWFGWKLLASTQRAEALHRADALDAPRTAEAAAGLESTPSIEAVQHTERLLAHREQHGPESEISREIAAAKARLAKLGRDAGHEQGSQTPTWLMMLRGGHRRLRRIRGEIAKLRAVVEDLEAKLGCGVRNCIECLTDEALAIRFPEAIGATTIWADEEPVEFLDSEMPIPEEHQIGWKMLSHEQREQARDAAVDFLREQYGEELPS